MVISANEDDIKSTTSDQIDILENVLSIGWSKCEKRDLKLNPENALELCVSNVLSGLSDSAASWSAGRQVSLILSDRGLKICSEFIHDQLIPKRNIRVWGIVKGMLNFKIRKKSILQCCIKINYT